RGQVLRVLGDIRRRGPAGAGAAFTQFAQILIHLRHKGIRLRRRGGGGFFTVLCLTAGRNQRHQPANQQNFVKTLHVHISINTSVYFSSPISFLIGWVKIMKTKPAPQVRYTTFMNTAGICSTWLGSRWPPARPAMILPSAEPMNQVPIIWPTNFGGASLVTELKPTGLRHSSPVVCKKYVRISQKGRAS